MKILQKKWIRILLLLSIPTLIILAVTTDVLVESISNAFQYIAKIKNLVYIIIGICALCGVLHLFLNSKSTIAKEHLLYKKIGPILSAPLTGATHGVLIYSGVQIIYIVCYDSTLIKYEGIDKTTMAVAMVSMMTYAVFGMSLIVKDILNPNIEMTGKIME